MVRVMCNEASLTGERAEIATSDLNRAISISRIDHAPEVLRNLKTNICADYRGKTPSLYRDGIRGKLAKYHRRRWRLLRGPLFVAHE